MIILTAATIGQFELELTHQQLRERGVSMAWLPNRDEIRILFSLPLSSRLL